MISWLRRRLRREPAAIDDVLWREAIAGIRLLDTRPVLEIEALRARVASFVSRIAYSGTHDLVVTPAMRLQVAVQACLPLLHLPEHYLGHWHEIILYPGQFRVRRHDRDEHTDVVTEWDDELAGEAWSQGPLILSWADIEQDLHEPFEGFNVVIHEIAHKIDMADGDSDGVPPIHDMAQRRRWKDVMRRAYEAHVEQVEREVDTPLDPYAAEAPDEFFAVLSEYYFSAPDVLAEHYLEVYGELAQFYGPVPMPRLDAVQR